MIPQITKRQIGDVTIVDIKGAFSGPWALRGKDLLSETFGSNGGGTMVLNLREMTSLDTLGARSIFEAISEKENIGILYGSEWVMDLMSRFLEGKRFRMFRDEQEILSAFGPHFVGTSSSRAEERTSVRLQTALPLKFYYEEAGEKVEFQAIVTNLNEKGLFAEYIDLKSAEKSLEHLSPYDLKLLHLILLLPRGNAVHAEGNVVHRKLDGEQVGIGIQFSKIGLKEQEAIRNFLNSYKL
ncbi:MAG: PilZ domain-containing protein [Candidatus Omnitrophica bacterium]|nr:PilZ domain-containing protein [Candidatus Omnitrophota bacterium]